MTQEDYAESRERNTVKPQRVSGTRGKGIDFRELKEQRLFLWEKGEQRNIKKTLSYFWKTGNKANTLWGEIFMLIILMKLKLNENESENKC